MIPDWPAIWKMLVGEPLKFLRMYVAMPTSGPVGVVHVVVTGDPDASAQGVLPLVVHAPNFAAAGGITVDDWFRTFSAFPLFRTIEPVGLNLVAPELKKMVTPSPTKKELLPMSRSPSIRKIPGR